MSTIYVRYGYQPYQPYMLYMASLSRNTFKIYFINNSTFLKFTDIVTYTRPYTSLKPNNFKKFNQKIPDLALALNLLIDSSTFLL